MKCGCKVDNRERYTFICPAHKAEWDEVQARWRADKLAQELGYISHEDRLTRENANGQ
jgi:hypothetical protein